MQGSSTCSSLVSMETNWVKKKNLYRFIEIPFDITQLDKMSLRQQLSCKLYFALKKQG